MALKLYNTASRQVEELRPLDAGHVRMYLCGPTVYDRAHIGNARSVVIFDVLSRLLERAYKVTYVRNITDIDDKIIKAAQESGETIDVITKRTTDYYHDDMDALGALRPTHSPRATDHVPEMIAMIETLLQKGHAYAAEGHVLFDVTSDPRYGCLSRHPKDEIIAGARVEVATYKKNPEDFVLWKPSSGDMPGWDSPWGWGRPGWHIECSAMSLKYLGETFDIHGGGQDLIFPHHENEIAQSTCALGKGTFAQHWLHNGMVMVNGAKMSKSLGNFYTVHDLLAQANGETIRFALLSSHYRQPLDWTDATLPRAKAALDSLYTALQNYEQAHQGDGESIELDGQVLAALEEDLNTPKAITRLHELAHQINKEQDDSRKQKLQGLLKKSAQVLGIGQKPAIAWFQEGRGAGDLNPQHIEQLIQQRLEARASKNFIEADRIRDALAAQGIVLEDHSAGTTWKRQ
jgi:cysteinyl-tRNA synthetase (EC 6.1.1.16)